MLNFVSLPYQKPYEITIMRPKLMCLTLLCAFFSISTFAQKKKKGMLAERVECKFGNVQPEDFAPTVYEIDSAATAVYLFAGGHTVFNGNTNGFFDVAYTVHERIRLLKSTSFDDLTKVKIYLHDETPAKEQKLANLQAVTYNIENGKVQSTKLDKSSIFKERDGEYNIVKFTFPNLHEGSIIEYTVYCKYAGYLPALMAVPG